MASREDVGPILNGIPTHLPDIDPAETQEWLDSLDAVIDGPGRMRARYLMLRMLERARAEQVGVPSLTTTDYVNTISPEQEPWFPGDEEAERRFRAYLRWNAAMIVHRAQRPGIGVGGHISTYASAATLYEVGFNHFFRGKDHPGGGDQIFFQGHASPGMYARAFLEGRLSEDRLDGFRQEKSHLVDGSPLALPSYPHPRLMSDFWEFPTVSMGIGPMINAADRRELRQRLQRRHPRHGRPPCGPRPTDGLSQGEAAHRAHRRARLLRDRRGRRARHHDPHAAVVAARGRRGLHRRGVVLHRRQAALRLLRAGRARSSSCSSGSSRPLGTTWVQAFALPQEAWFGGDRRGPAGLRGAARQQPARHRPGPRSRASAPSRC